MSNTVTGIVTRVETTGHTYYGNPIKVVTLQLTEAKHPFVEGVQLDFRISDNASLAFEIGNGEFRDEPRRSYLAPGPLMYILTRENGNMLMGTDNRPVIFDTYSEAVANRFGSFTNIERAN